MSKTAFTTIFMIVASFVVFYIGYCVGGYKTAFTEECIAWKNNMINLQYDALEKADSIMVKNNLFDADGSDVMADYLKITAEIDSIWKEEL